MIDIHNEKEMIIEMEHKGTVTLSSDRLILRKFTMVDAEAMYRNWQNDPEVTKYLRWTAHKNISVTKEVVSSWIAQYQNSDFYQWAIVPKKLQEPIGSISVVDMNEQTNTVHIGYCIGKKWWHMGYTSEAMKTIMPFLFLDVGANRLESQHDPNNPNSGAVMKKCGLKFEGILRSADWSNQGIVDAAMYSMLAEEFQTDSIR